MRDLFREIKYAYQRVVRGYDSRIYWEFDSYFYQFLPAIKKFCEDELKETIDKRRIEIFTETLRLLKELEEMPIDDFYKNDNQITRFWTYFGKNITIYWD